MSTKETKNEDGPYPQMVGLDYKLFQLSNNRLSEEQQNQALQQLETYLKGQQKNFLGYQVTQTMAYSEKLAFLLDMHTNNIGDPFENGNCTMNTKMMERAVLDYFANLWHAPTPSDRNNQESYWGYILSMGGTEGNLYALYNARDYLKGKQLFRELNNDLSYIRPLKDENSDNKHAYHPIAFYSEDTHYSIIKILRSSEIRTFYEVGEREYASQCPITSDGRWPKEVPSENGTKGPGSIDIDKLVRLVEFFARTGSPPLIILNIGTTFKGAYDNVEEIGHRLMPILKKYKLDKRIVEYAPGHSDERTGFWIHIDGALSATYLPFLAKAGDRIQGHIPKFDFSLPFVHSIVTSAHKFPGCPMPSGIYMTKRKYQIAPPDQPEYIGSPDTTFAGSRNAISPAVLWCYYANTSEQDEIDKAIQVEETARYAEMKLKQLDKEYQKLGYDLWVERTALSLAIRFRDPNDHELTVKYSLSQMKLKIDDEKQERKYVHIFIMPGVTKQTIDQLIQDLKPAYDQQMHSNDKNEDEPSKPHSDSKHNLDLWRIGHIPVHNRGYSGN